jgi:hypothetical protein
VHVMCQSDYWYLKSKQIQRFSNQITCVGSANSAIVQRSEFKMIDRFSYYWPYPFEQTTTEI